MCSARAQLGLADANRLPTMGAGLSASCAPNSPGGQATSLAVGLQLSSWEIDLFGRLASQRTAERAVSAAVLQAGPPCSRTANCWRWPDKRGTTARKA